MAIRIACCRVVLSVLPALWAACARPTTGPRAPAPADAEPTRYGTWTHDDVGLPAFDADLQRHPVPYHAFAHLIGGGDEGPAHNDLFVSLANAMGVTTNTGNANVCKGSLAGLGRALSTPCASRPSRRRGSLFACARSTRRSSAPAR